jgi:hypothetical protein
VNQIQLRTQANDRIADAVVLMAGGRWSFAYYVVGYAVECALKSCVLARMTHTGGVFQDKKFAEKCFTHNFNELVKLAELTTELNAHLAANPAFVGNWGTAGLWTETSRYESKAQSEAEALYNAITNVPDGVLMWTQSYW